ncbi:MAG: PHP domain-containing protein [Myxococcaceae bacterium]
MTSDDHLRTGVRWTLRALLAALIVLLLYTALFSVAAFFTHYPLTAAPPPTQLRGAYHLHSLRSDGRASPEEIARTAKRAGLDFVITTDHNPDDAPAPVYVDGVLLIAGAEFSTPFGHLTALGLSRAITREEMKTDPIGLAHSLGALTFLAHPIQKKRPWIDWKAAQRATGLELYSADSMFRDAQRSPFSRFLPAVGAFVSRPVHGLMTVVDAQPAATDKLLELSRAGSKVALCAHDAHGLPPYESEFRTLSFYLPFSAGRQLPADPVAATKLILDSIAAGTTYCVFHGLAEGSGFRLRGISARRSAYVGDIVEVVDPAQPPLVSRIEVRGSAKLLPDGRSVQLQAPGAVQIELWVLAPGRFFGTEWKPWIVPSPIQVLPPSSQP